MTGELKDRGADFQPPAIAKASAIAHARYEAVVASQVQANAEAEARDNAAADAAAAAVVPAPVNARGSVTVEEGAARAKRSMEEGQIRRNRGYADDGIPKPPLDGVTSTSRHAVPMVTVPVTPVPASAPAPEPKPHKARE